MCVKCGKIFTPVMWDGWEIKYLSTNKVYVCEDCNPNLKKSIQEEKIIISLYHENKNKIESKESKVWNFCILNSILFLADFIFLAFGLPLLFFIFSAIIIAILEAYLIIKENIFSNQIKNMKTEESRRKIAFFNSVKQYDGNLLEKRFIPEFCQRCRWFNNDDLKCHVDEEVGEIYNEFNVNGEKECFEPRN